MVNDDGSLRLLDDLTVSERAALGILAECCSRCKFRCQRPWVPQLAGLLNILAISSYPGFGMTMLTLLLTSPGLLFTLLFRRGRESSSPDYAAQYRQTAEEIQAQCGMESPWPPMFAQEVVARQVACTGAGIHLEPDILRVEELRASVDRVLSTDSFRVNAERLGRAFRQTSASAAAEVVQRSLHESG